MDRTPPSATVPGGCAIYDAERLARAMAASPSDIRAYLLAFFPEAEIPPLGHADPSAPPLTARINHGVWIASCPCRTPGDPAPGLVVWLAAPWGWCLRCRNRETGGWWRPVTVPSAEERAAIEAALDARPSRSAWNWEPGESTAALLAENAEHGVGV